MSFADRMGSSVPLSPVAQARFDATREWFEERRESRKKELGGGVEIVAAAPVGDAAASIKIQNDKMGVKDPAKPGFGAQVVPQNQPPIQGAGQAPKRAGGQINQGVAGGRVNVAPKRGTTDAPLSKAYLEGQRHKQEFFENAGDIRKAQMEKRK